MQGKHLDVPGNLCKHIGINTEHNRIDITNSPDFFIHDVGNKVSFKATPRIGISQGKEKL